MSKFTKDFHIYANQMMDYGAKIRELIKHEVDMRGRIEMFGTRVVVLDNELEAYTEVGLKYAAFDFEEYQVVFITLDQTMYTLDDFRDDACYDIAYAIMHSDNGIRYFANNERVYVESDTIRGLGAIVPYYGGTYSSDDQLAVAMCDGSIELIKAVDIYKRVHINKHNACSKCQHAVYYEHHKDVQYPFYCPECDENLYTIETY